MFNAVPKLLLHTIQLFMHATTEIYILINKQFTDPHPAHISNISTRFSYF
jgi:hypothetical protein